MFYLFATSKRCVNLFGTMSGQTRFDHYFASGPEKSHPSSSYYFKVLNACLCKLIQGLTVKRKYL